MRFVKLGIISIVFFALIITAFSMLFPSSINISRAIDINAPRDSVFEQIANLNNWKNWYDDSSAIFISGKTNGEGSVLKTGNALITVIVDSDSTIKANWNTLSGDKMPGEFTLISSAGSAHSTIQWNLVHNVNWYPWEKLSLLVSNKTITPFMEKSLENLKNFVEKN